MSRRTNRSATVTVTPHIVQAKEVVDISLTTEIPQATSNASSKAKRRAALHDRKSKLGRFTTETSARTLDQQSTPTKTDDEPLNTIDEMQASTTATDDSNTYQSLPTKSPSDSSLSPMNAGTDMENLTKLFIGLGVSTAILLAVIAFCIYKREKYRKNESSKKDGLDDLLYGPENIADRKDDQTNIDVSIKEIPDNMKVQKLTTLLTIDTCFTDDDTESFASKALNSVLEKYESWIPSPVN